MSDSVLDIGYKLSDDVGIPRYTNLVGNEQQNARKILTSIKDALDIDVFYDVDWEMLKKSASISVLGGGVTTYALPSDFDRICNGTLWDDTNYREVRGPVDLNEWQRYNKGLEQLAGLELICRIQGDQANNTKVITFYPDTSAVTVSFWYVSNRPVISSGGTLKTSITADDDQLLPPSKVIKAAAKWRLLRSLGMSFDDERIEYTSLLDDLSANDSGGKVIHTGRSLRYDVANIPKTGYGS